MTQRTVQLIGYTSGCEIAVDWNNTKVFTGAITAQGNMQNPEVLAEWTTDMDVTGNVPLKITCTSGQLWFANIFMNYITKFWTISAAAIWPQHTPDTNELANDLAQLSSEQLLEKYAVDSDTLQTWLVEADEPDPASVFGQPFDISDLSASDGKNNLVINGFPQSRDNVETWGGAWHWQIKSDGILSCDFAVLPPVI